jgi:hypothetical protein
MLNFLRRTQLKKSLLPFLFIVSLFLFFSCNKEKTTEYENTIVELTSQIALLHEENENMKKEIASFNLID